MGVRCEVSEINGKNEFASVATHILAYKASAIPDVRRGVLDSISVVFFLECLVN